MPRTGGPMPQNPQPLPVPRLKTLADFERYIVNEELVDTPEQARAVIAVARSVINKETAA